MHFAMFCYIIMTSTLNYIVCNAFSATNLVSVNITQIILTRCQIFAFKMHQIQCRLGLCPDPIGELTALPRSASWIWEGKGKRKNEGQGKERGKD